MAVRFQLRRDTAANWASANSVLALGEPGVETDTLKVKVGDGSTAWNSLAYSITKDFTDLTSKPTTLAGYGITDSLALNALSVTQNAASGDGALTYNNATGVFSYTPPNFEGLSGNFTGSVFADDSTIMVDGVSATINLANNTTTDLAEGTNLYYTDVRADARIAAAGITDLSDADQTVQTTDDVTFNSVTGNVITTQIDSGDSSAIEIQTDVTMLAGLTVGNHIIPSSSENIDLGSASARFRDLYLSGNSAVIGDLALKRHASGGLLVSDHSTGNPTNVTTHNITANDITVAGDVDVTGNLTMTGYIAGPATMTIDPAAVGDNTGTVVIAGDLQVDGTTTTINSTTLNVDDKNIVLSSGSPNAAGSDGAGITVDNGSDADATIIYDGINDQWELNKDIHLPDTAKAIFGAGSDLQIYHTGSHSWVQDAGTGNLYIAGEQLWLTNSDNTKQFLKGDSTGRVDLYYTTSVKLATTSTGIDVTGEITASGDISTTGGDVDITGAQPRVNLKETDTTDLDVTLRLNAGDLIIETRSDAGTALGDRIRAASNGDISFYEDTGTTPKFFWDASSESLSVGTNGSTGDRRFQVSGNPNDNQTGTQQFGIVANPTYNTNPTSNIFNIYTGPNLTAGTTLTNLYNLYLESNNTAGSTVTNKYGLYQAGSNDQNYFAGNVGIGTNSPTNGRVEIQTTSTSAGLWVQTGGANSDYTVADFRTGTNAPALVVKGDGNVGIGNNNNLSNDLGTLLNVNNATVIGNNTGGAYFGYNARYDGAWEYNETSAVGILSFTNSGNLTYRTAASGAAGSEPSLTEVIRTGDADPAYVTFDGASQVRLTLGNEGDPGTNTANWIRGNAGYLQYNSAGNDHTWEVSGSERLRLYTNGDLKTTRQLKQGNSDGTPRFLNIPYASAASGFTFDWQKLANSTTEGDQTAEANAFMFEVNLTSYLGRYIKAIIVVDTNADNSLSLTTLHNSTITMTASIPTDSELITLTFSGLWGNSTNYMGRITTF